MRTSPVPSVFLEFSWCCVECVLGDVQSQSVLSRSLRMRAASWLVSLIRLSRKTSPRSRSMARHTYQKERYNCFLGCAL